MRPRLFTVLSAACLSACAGTVDGSRARGVDGGAGPTDVAPGLNPDGFDPFRPVDSGVIRVDGSVGDTGTWQLPDGSVFDQRYATIYVGTLFNGTTPSSYASAEFRLVPRTDDPRCMVTGAGSWDLQQCDLMGAGPMDPHPLPFPTPGRITISGGTQAVYLSANANGQYSPYFEENTVFPGPRTVRVQAPGMGLVPPVDFTLQIPPTVVPLNLPGDRVTLSRDQDLVVRWTPIASRSVWLTLTLPTGTTGGTRWVRINNECPGDSGECVVPRRALRNLQPTADGRTGILTVLPYNATSAHLGQWPVLLTAVGQGRAYEAVVR